MLGAAGPGVIDQHEVSDINSTLGLLAYLRFGSVVGVGARVFCPIPSFRLWDRSTRVEIPRSHPSGGDFGRWIHQLCPWVLS